MYRVRINGKVVEHSFKTGDRVCVGYRNEDTGTVNKVTGGGLFIEIDWDDHCRHRLGRNWMPESIKYIETTESAQGDSPEAV